MKTITLDQTYTVSDETAQKIQELIDKDKKVTYEQIEKELYHKELSIGFNSQKKVNKIQAITKLLNVAKYLNKDWQPDWNKNNWKCFISIGKTGKIKVDAIRELNFSIAYFKTPQLAQQAIDILGEETIRTALSTDY